MSTLTGTGAALRVTVRRHGFFWAAWVVGLTLLMPATASQYDTVIPPGTDPRLTIEPLRHSPAMLAILGPAYDLYDKGGFIFWRAGGFTAMLAGLMGALGIVRATRGEEEAGRVELLRSGPMGRHAPTLAAVTVALGACLLAGATNAAALVALGLPAAGSLAAGLAVALTGAAYVGAGAVAAQVLDSARTARGWAAGVGVGGAYLVRAVLDGAGPDAAAAPLRWAVPLEWGMLARPFADERWWVLGLPAALTVTLLCLASWLESRRDHGSGLRSTGLGPASGRLRSAWGLALRLQRGVVAGWTIGLVTAAVALGSIVVGLGDAYAANPELAAMVRRMGGTDELGLGFQLGILLILTTLVAVMAVGMLGLLRAEEQTGHAELLLATATSRTRLALSHLVPAVVAPSVVLLAVGAGLPLVPAVRDADGSQVVDLLVAAAALWPGLVLVVGLATALLGWAPRAFPLVWAVLGWAVFCTWFAILFDLPAWLVDAQPWGHLTVPPRDEMDWWPFGVELAAGVVLAAAGLAGYRQRDLR